MLTNSLASPRNLRSGAILQQIPHGGYGLMPLRTFVITPDTVTTSAEDPPRSLQWRRREESPMFCKIVLRPDVQSVDDLVIEHGNHHVKSVCGREIPCVKLEELGLMHVPVRSRDQFIAKIIVGWMASLARDPAVRSSGLTWHKRDDFDRIANGRVIDDKALCEFSFLYAQASKSIDWRADVVKTDLPFDYVRRYSSRKTLKRDPVDRAFVGNGLFKLVLGRWTPRGFLPANPQPKCGLGTTNRVPRLHWQFCWTSTKGALTYRARFL